MKDPQLFHHVLSSNIRLNAELGRLDVARALADELLPTVGVGARLDGLIEFAWVAGRIGMAGPLRERLAELEPATSLWLKAGREILDGQFTVAADTFDEIGSVPDEAEARLRAGQALLADGRRADAGKCERSPSTARSARPATSASASRPSPTRSSAGIRASRSCGERARRRDFQAGGRNSGSPGRHGRRREAAPITGPLRRIV